MLPVNCGSHADCQNFVVTNLRKYYPDPDSLSRSTWDIIERFWNLDLSFTDEKLRSKYSVFGPKPSPPSCMHRSYLLSLDFKVTSLTEWAVQLKINPLYAILSGFDFGDTPSVGTFYDFMNHLWDSDEDNFSLHLHPPKVSVEQLLEELENTSFSIEEQPNGSLFQLFRDEFLKQSLSKGLIKPENLSLADDGTPFSE